ncbi:MAG: hypothetical protein LC122_00725 [Chitinophagales bacterium]|nr:hypothetical protein [Chitinophagales bacterium]
MKNETPLTEHESLNIITSMIQNAKASYHDSGMSAILWGLAVSIASLLVYVQITLNFTFPIDPFWIVFIAIIPQIYISLKERKENKVVRFEDAAINAVWSVYGITILLLVMYANIAPAVSKEFANQEGWQLIKHYINGSKPDAEMYPFIPSLYSLYILLYTFPTMVTGIAKKFRPMIVGGIISYILFIMSCYTSFKNDMLIGAVVAIICWLIPGIILRSKYLKQRKNNV